MRAQLVGFTVKGDRYPSRGERIASWVEDYMARTGTTVSEFAFRTRADKRDIRRLINEKSCGPRLNDALEEVFGYDFIDAVALPVVGDRITALEREVANERAKMAAKDAQIAREKALRTARAAAPGGELRLVASEDRAFNP